MIAFITRDDVITFFSVLVSIVVALLMVPYAEQWQRRRRSGEDYQYALHLLQALYHLGENEHNRARDEDALGNSRLYKWKEILRIATDRINSSTDSPDYKVADKEHSRQLREACFRLFERQGVLSSDPAKIAQENEDQQYTAIALLSWRLSAVGLKVLQRTMERESKDEQYAVFERFYRFGYLPSPRSGEEHGHHHHEYLEYVLPDEPQNTNEDVVRGDFVVRADDEQTVGFLIRARVQLEERYETMFRFVECPVDSSEYERPLSVTTELRDVREKVDKAWPSDGLATSRPRAHKILTKLARFRNAGEDYGYDVPALHFLAWSCCRDDIVETWSSGTDVISLSFELPEPLREARNLLERLGHGLYDEQADALSQSYPRPVVDSVQSIMDQEDLDDAARLQNLKDLIRERGLAKIGLPKIQAAIGPEQVELDSWIAFLPAHPRQCDGQPAGLKPG